MEAFLKTGKLGSGGGSAGLAVKEKKPEKSSAPIPWVEKYRPKCVDDVAYQDEVCAVLKKSLSGSDLPNLLFYGPPGTGKTSTILALAHELFGSIYKDRILELNASDERGIQVVRDKIKKFAQFTASGVRPDGKSCPAFKIIILDEADSMTRSAQDALRRTMEKEGKSTKFCLICNYVSRIIEPITSRCAKFRFKPLSKKVLLERLTDIAVKENLKISEENIETLITISEGDMRKAITSLQSCARLASEESISKNDIFEIASVISNEWIEKFFAVCKLNSYDKMDNFVEQLLAEGYSAGQLIKQLHESVVEDSDMNNEQKSLICEKLALCDFRLLDGADEYLQILDFSTFIMKQLASC